MDSKVSTYGMDQKNALNGSQQVADQYVCDQCHESIEMDQRDEHTDWHFAKSLDEQETGGSAATSHSQAVPSYKQPDIKQSRDQKNDQPPTYAPPSHPPPKIGPSMAAPIRAHTNQVIEAAKVRARDEVRLFRLALEDMN